ncbi:PREDICTED: mitogen-activated protein kinase kinase kinase 2 [Erythranthe guttata]|uniref:mitogen-activated protein kinase kinase kinase 2 n=1 Tax=Erythranthe guttata TaxID=4155 RepID=UPI00064DDC41|nr:PREDICTED: mitogen-activated protein kinase kinase kinase 2 [Erythranthe guttata]|eukprot:XP_012841581.1 PREDICTED: mitogen-activated protein kinase kinase kinase 2 [Erythranthe guttata]
MAAAWTRGPTIGRGSSASVSLATTAGGEVFAAVKSTDLSSSASLQKEGILISQLSSPYIVKCLGSDITCEESGHVYNLFLEYLPGGTLSDRIKKQGGSLDETAIGKHAHGILMGLNYLHTKGLVHCDIKGENILLGENGSVKIADFGCAKRVGSGGSGFSGTPAYMAPETARGEEQGFAADVWALGCTVVEMATGSHPWPEMKDPAAALYRVGFSGDVPETPAWFSGQARDFLDNCLTRDPRERWTAAELLRHPFMIAASAEEGSGEVIGEFAKRASPTSVMDQDFWDALEVPENPMEISSDSDSPAGRIMDLIGDGLSYGGWTEEEGWLTVRGDETEEDLTAEAESVNFSVLTEYSFSDCFVTHTECVKDLDVLLTITIDYEIIMLLIELFLHHDQLSLQFVQTKRNTNLYGD